MAPNGGMVHGKSEMNLEAKIFTLNLYVLVSRLALISVELLNRGRKNHFLLLQKKLTLVITMKHQKLTPDRVSSLDLSSNDNANCPNHVFF